MRGPEKRLKPHELAEAVGTRQVSGDLRRFMSLRTKPDILSYLGITGLRTDVDLLIQSVPPAPIFWSAGDLLIGNTAGGSTLFPIGDSAEQLTVEGTTGKLVWVKDTDYGNLSDDYGSVADAALAVHDYGSVA